MSDDTIEALLLEQRKFPPSEAFKKSAHVVGAHLYDEANADYEAFWARQAEELVSWSAPWNAVCEWKSPFSKWFIGGKLNVAYNCLDRHVEAGRGSKVAIHWEGEPGDTRTITYADLLDEVQRFANVLKGLGVAKGDRVNIYLPMVPEAAGWLDAEIAGLADWNFEAPVLYERTMSLAEELGASRKKFQAPVRVAVTGRSVGPPLFESMAILGRDETLRRLRMARARLEG